MTYGLNINHLIEIARSAGNIIMDYYHTPLQWSIKPDDSPVTVADLKANQFIVQALAAYTPNIPVVAEENPAAENLKHVSQQYFWLVDPLDGTKAFIAGLDEFTVNIALIKDSQPVLGVIYLPVQGVLYYNLSATSAYKQIQLETAVAIQTKKTTSPEIIITTGRSPANSMFVDFIAKYSQKTITLMSSSYKFCLIAEGSADIYPHFNPTMEWDTAAGQIILSAAGGGVYLENGSPLAYGKAKFLNPNFIAHNGAKDFMV